MWTIGETVREAWRNLWRPGVAAVGGLLAILLTYGAFVEMTATARALDRFELWVAEGGMVWSVESDDGISGNVCAAAADDRAVILSGGAGAIGGSDLLRFLRSPNVDFTAQPMTVSAAEIISGTAPTMAGWTLGSTAADELGVVSGDRLRTSSEDAEVVLTFGYGPRVLGYDRDVIQLVPVSNIGFSTCWIELDPVAFGIPPDVLGRRYPPDSVVRPFRRTEPFDHPSFVYSERQSQTMWRLTAAVGAGLWLGWFWVRRREFILYRSLGLSRAGVVLMGVTEATLVSFVAAIVASGVVTAVSPGGQAATAGIWTAATSGTATLILVHLLLIPLARRNIAKAARDV